MLAILFSIALILAAAIPTTLILLNNKNTADVPKTNTMPMTTTSVAPTKNTASAEPTKNTTSAATTTTTITTSTKGTVS